MILLKPDPGNRPPSCGGRRLLCHLLLVPVELLLLLCALSHLRDDAGHGEGDDHEDDTEQVDDHEDDSRGLRHLLRRELDASPGQAASLLAQRLPSEVLRSYFEH